jgi:hypothetical protein
MILIPKDVYAQYIVCLRRNSVDVNNIQNYIKWLRYYLDYCAKHVIVPNVKERLRLFLSKLLEKGQSEERCQ